MEIKGRALRKGKWGKEHRSSVAGFRVFGAIIELEEKLEVDHRGS